jgi:translation initiation factor 2 beta subunit (eIF-2beta)/eIF-5
MLPKKHASESEKRKKKRRIEGLIESQRGSIDNFFKSNTSTIRNPNEWAIVAVDEIDIEAIRSSKC